MSKNPTSGDRRPTSPNARARGQSTKSPAAAPARRPHARRLQLAAVVAVVAVVVALVLVKVTGDGGSPPTTGSAISPPAGTPVAPALLRKLRTIPVRTLAAASTAGLVTSPQAISDPALSAAGKPELLYIGAEFCPICATERWAMYVALAKFGTFSPQPGRIHSAVQDGDISTLTFYGTTYRSPYLTFTPVETTTNQPKGDYYVALLSPTPAQQRLWEAHTDQSFPWLDFGGHLELSSAQYSPTILEGLGFDTIASQIGDNHTPIGADVDAAAGALVRTICTTMSDHRPAAVCSAAGSG